MQERFVTGVTQDEIRGTIAEALEQEDSIFEFEDVGRFRWETDVIDLDDITVNEDVFNARSNVALYEREIAIERAQLSVGDGRPLIVLGEDNYLIEGYARYQVLQKEFESTNIIVYRGFSDIDQSPETLAKEKLSLEV